MINLFEDRQEEIDELYDYFQDNRVDSEILTDDKIVVYKGDRKFEIERVWSTSSGRDLFDVVEVGDFEYSDDKLLELEVEQQKVKGLIHQA